MRKPSNTFTTIISANMLRRSRRGFPFVPGVLLMLLGLVVVCAPRLLIGAIAIFLMGMGALCCFVAWKVAQFKKQLRTVAKDMEAKIRVEGFQMQHPDIEVEPSDYKKIVIH